MGDETRMQVRELKKGVEAVGGIAERYMIRWLGPSAERLQGCRPRTPGSWRFSACWQWWSA